MGHVRRQPQWYVLPTPLTASGRARPEHDANGARMLDFLLQDSVGVHAPETAVLGSAAGQARPALIHAYAVGRPEIGCGNEDLFPAGRVQEGEPAPESAPESGFPLVVQSRVEDMDEAVLVLLCPFGEGLLQVEAVHDFQGTRVHHVYVDAGWPLGHVAQAVEDPRVAVHVHGGIYPQTRFRYVPVASHRKRLCVDHLDLRHARRVISTTVADLTGGVCNGIGGLWLGGAVSTATRTG